MTKNQYFRFILLWILFSPLVGFAQTVPKIKLVFVQGGTFTMGCTREQSGCGEDEHPTHEVTLSDYHISKYEITQAQWRAVMGSNPSEFSGCDDCPVERVSWEKARDFCIKLSQLTGKKYRLPTEAQWEYAARGGSKSKGYVYAGSNKIEEVAWYDDENANDKRTQSVGKKKPNELGIYDMSGNVWEWCLDVYGSNYYNESPSKNPEGPLEGDKGMVLRGGGWNSNLQHCRVASRHNFTPTFPLIGGGFRVVLLP